MNNHRFVWHDLNTKDLDGAKRFYGEVFHWKFDGSANGPYVHITAGDQMIGGMRQMDANEPTPPSWLGYVGTDDRRESQRRGRQGVHANEDDGDSGPARSPHVRVGRARDDGSRCGERVNWRTTSGSRTSGIRSASHFARRCSSIW